jgi:hypothetical protein
MIGFISSWVIHSHLITLTYWQYSAIAHLHTFQFTVAHALGYSLSISRLLANGFRHTNYHRLTLQMLTHKSGLLLTRKIFTGRRTFFFFFTSLHFASPLTRTLNRDLLQLRTFHGCLPPWSTRERASVSPINLWSDTRETLLPTVLQLLRHCWRGHVYPPHSCVIQVFIGVDWQQMRRGEAMRDSSRHGRAQLDSAQRKHRFVYCCVIAGTCFDVTVIAWRKYATLHINTNATKLFIVNW